MADWVLAAEALGSANFLPNLTQVVCIHILIPRIRTSVTDVVTQTLPGAHWVQLEFPHRVNALIRNFLLTL